MITHTWYRGYEHVEFALQSPYTALRSVRSLSTEPLGVIRLWCVFCLQQDLKMVCASYCTGLFVHEITDLT
jgi:hypothetical protein